MNQTNRMQLSRRFFTICSLTLLAGLTILPAGCKQKTEAESGRKKFYWVQALRNHPVHQLTQNAFKEACAKLGYDSEVIGTTSADTPGTMALVEQVMAKGDAAGFGMWAADPTFYPLIAECGRRHIPVVIVHFPVKEGTVPGLTAVSSCDPLQYAKDCAIAIGDQIKQKYNGKGTVAVTEGAPNVTEDAVVEEFNKTMKANYPDIKVLPTEIEGFDPTHAIQQAANILRAHPDVVAALTTTGGEPPTWPGAAEDTHRDVINIAMNYTRANLDAVKNGKMFAIAGQPLWEESYQAAELLDKSVRGEKVPYWAVLPAPLITKDKLDPYYAIMDKADAAAKK